MWYAWFHVCKSPYHDKTGYFVGIIREATLLSTVHLSSSGAGNKTNREERKDNVKRKRKIKEKKQMNMGKKRIKDLHGKKK